MKQTPSTSMSRSTQLLGLVGWLLLTFSAAALGALASVRADSFYLALVRPDWSPPVWLFGPVWTMLYLLMAVAAWRVWRDRGWREAQRGLLLYVVQLAANALWTWLFFVWHQGALAFIEILLLWSLILATLLAFWRRQRLAALLLLPYLAWVSFATVLSFTLWQLNPAILG